MSKLIFTTPKSPWPMEDLIDFKGTADWRRMKYNEFPDDRRNLEAAEKLDQLGLELVSLEGSDLHNSLAEAIRLLEEDEADSFYRYNETISERMRDIGFREFPQDAASFVRSLIQDLIER